MPDPQLNSILNAVNPRGGRKISKGSTFAVTLRPAFFESIFEDYEGFLKQTPGALGMILFEFFQPDQICAVPHTATAFANRGQYQNVLVNPVWTDPALDGVCAAYARAMALKFDAEMERGKREGEVKLEVEGVGQYGNYDGELDPCL